MVKDDNLFEDEISQVLHFATNRYLSEKKLEDITLEIIEGGGKLSITDPRKKNLYQITNMN